jgi:hypothetical protein
MMMNGQCIVSELKTKEALQRNINFLHQESIVSGEERL